MTSFHAQRAAEKSLKAVLVAEQIRFERTHDLERLVGLIPGGWTVPPPERLASLTPYALAGRYPESLFGPGPDPSWEDATLAIDLAEEVLSGVTDGMRERGFEPPRLS